MKVLQFYPKFHRGENAHAIVRFRANGSIYFSPALLAKFDAATSIHHLNRNDMRMRVEYVEDGSKGMVRFIPDPKGYRFYSGKNMFLPALARALPDSVMNHAWEATVSPEGVIVCTYNINEEA